MATLRDLRKQAQGLGIVYKKETTADELQEMITEKMIEAESAPPIAPDISSAPPPDSPVEEAAPEVGKGSPAPKASFSDEVAINEADLNTEFKNQASKYADFAEAEARAKAKVMSAKLRFEVVDSQMTKKCREQLIADGVPKPTEKMVRSEVVISDEYKAAQQQLIDATCAADIAKGAKEAFMHRKDMLIQLGSAHRQEKDQIGMNLKEKAKEVMKAS